MLKLDIRNKKDLSLVQKLAKREIPDVLRTGITNKQFVTLINDEVPIDGFVGYVEVDKAVLDLDVPENFPNSFVQIDEEKTRQKTWREYCVYKENGKLALLQIGYRDSNGNRSGEVKNDELLLWVEHFGIENIMTKSKGKQRILNKYTPEEDIQGEVKI